VEIAASGVRAFETAGRDDDTVPATNPREVPFRGDGRPLLARHDEPIPTRIFCLVERSIRELDKLALFRDILPRVRGGA
jgi:hypothetical protein